MADVNADAGRCWLDLGNPHRAAAAIGAGLGELDPRRSRTKTVFLTYRAQGSLRSHDVSAAATDDRTALDSGARRCVDLVSTFIRRLEDRSERPMAELHAYARERLAG
ncbi:hypothetical protein M4V62_42510 [Streptomyces durmitorensis]|uniref:SAV-6107-like HEPN domain-containing protein n=1 Tax=Streptomyces durmitorensis TaxID=319947 RepID=A0ABY4Q512_9ACTN|nr:hypothetical protein [Streptomyces durmitorensis]UQT61216.1 hypothetical protein M4V62_42510 [Streptomyces durmitorensis]